MNANPSIFRAYDIRGIYPAEIDDDAVYAIGKGYATLLSRENPGKKLTVAVGRDMRTSSPALQRRLIEGLLECGIDVHDMGLVSTPTFYFGVAFFNYDGGLQISASHSPKEWNGVKLTRARAASLSKESGIADIASLVTEARFVKADAPGILGSRNGVLDALVDEFLKLVPASRIKPFTVIADVANAMGGVDIEALFRKLECRLIPMNFDLDGTFPAHEADPQRPENIKDLQDRMRREKVDLGIATDGDGDRIFFLDETGQVVPSEIMAALLAEIELELHPGGAIVTDANPARTVEDIARRFGGRRVRSKVGHSYMKQVITRESAIFGGEAAGHYFYPLPYGAFETPVLLILKLLARMSEKNLPLSELVKPFRTYAHSGEINVRVGSREEVAASIQKVKEAYADGEQDFLDGISVTYPDYWFIVRGSNTEPMLRLNVEAKTEERVREETERLRRVIAG